MKRGQLIVFEGANEVGKSTLARRLATSFNERNTKCFLLAFPGKQPGTVGGHVYALHHDPHRFGIDSMTPTSLQLLHVAAHVDAIQTKILPALRRGDTIILDRYWWSTWVYGNAAGADKKTLQAGIAAELTLWKSVRPNHAFLITRQVPLDTVRSVAEWQAVSREYRKLARSEGRRHPVHVVENNSTVDAAFQTVMRALTAK